MSVLDSSIGLIFSIKGDSSEARADLEKFSKDVDKHSKDIETAGKNSFNRFAQSIGLSSEETAKLGAVLPVVGAALTAVTAIVIGTGVALFGLAKQASDFGSEIKDASDKTGLGAESISTLKLAADQSGSSLEAISGSVTKFSKLIGSAAEGSKEAKDSLIRLGLDPKTAINDLDGSLEKVFKQIYDAKNPIVATKLATEAFGKSGADLIPVIKQMNGDFAAFREEAKKLGVVLTDADAQAADDFGDQLTTLEAQSKSIANQFGLGLAPAITTAMGEIGGSLKGNVSVWRDWGEQVGNIILRIERGAKVLSAIVSGNPARVLAALAQNAEAYQEDERRKAKQDALNDPNRAKFLKSQDKDIARIGGTDTGLVDEEAKKDREKAEAGQLAAREKFAAANKANFEQSFTELQRITLENYKNQLTTAEKFHEEFAENERQFQAKITQLISNEYDIRVSQEKNKTAQNALRIEQRTTIEKIVNESNKRIADAEKTVTETKKTEADKQAKIDDDRVKKSVEKLQNEIELKDAANRTLAARDAANVAGNLLTQDDADNRAILRQNELFELKKKNLAKQLIAVKGNAEETTRVLQEQDLLREDIDTAVEENRLKAFDKRKKSLEDEKQKLEEIKAIRLEILQVENEILTFRNEQARKSLVNVIDSNQTGSKDRFDALIKLRDFDLAENERQRSAALKQSQLAHDLELSKIADLNKERDKVQEIINLYNTRNEAINQQADAKKAEIKNSSKPSIDQAEVDKIGGGALTGLIDGLGTSVDSMLAKVEPLKGIGNIIGSQFQAIANGVGNAVKAFVLFGTAGGSFKKFAAEVIASVAQMSIVQAVFELAQGFAMSALAYFTGNPKYAASATAHYIAAGIYGSIGGVAAVVGRSVAGDSFKQQTSTGGGGSNGDVDNRTSGDKTNSNNSSNGNGGKAYSGTQETRIIEEDRLRRQAPQEHHFTIEVKSKDSHIIDVVHQDLTGEGKTKRAVVKISKDE